MISTPATTAIAMNGHSVVPPSSAPASALASGGPPGEIPRSIGASIGASGFVDPAGAAAASRARAIDQRRGSASG